ncbi:pyrroline-5-carboxylate reductase [Asticcacaulis sp. BYS171W]|uniref:Pyrroline-5-carboxylate reductase n=1 Tax=Asticcacaulis aquaticus TaxID=2984212 RepID=A0ABT5HVG7_9CAUL|nr:pyrroline-5-carboxylate reductase [Asticcacaulis aquaticus]MDC7683840.1 pyrroline-5-carboxylate reductase [Asticcacaulis aquaticus]
MLAKPILLVGAGALGSAILKGMRVAGHVAPQDVIILDLTPGEEAQKYAGLGARLNPGPEVWSEAWTVILAVKPQSWRGAAQILSGNLNTGATLVSVMAGVRTDDLSAVFAPLSVARVMPTTGVATGKGVASLFSGDGKALQAASDLFAPMASTVVLDHEGLIDAATAVSGSGPAYVYAFASALESAGLATGLTPADAKTLARATLISAVNLLDATGEEPEDLIRKVASPGGTTEAALKVLRKEGKGLDELIKAAVLAAQKRSQELG